jgi:glutamyl-tRNA reductase
MSCFVLIGLNHKTASVSIREKASFTPEEVSLSLPKLKEKDCIEECLILSTCNRTEVIVCSLNKEIGEQSVIDFLCEKSETEKETLMKHLYILKGNEVVRHLFRVAPGLESMVLGEPQIAGQVKDAFEKAIEAGTANRVLTSLYRHTLQTVKAVRNETEISKSAVSVSYVAVELARKVFGKLEGKQALLVGAGEMCELAATHLKERGVDKVNVVNRTLSKAQELAKKYGGEGFPFDKLFLAMADADIVISSTGATQPVILKSQVVDVMKHRKHKTLLMLDIAVPRDIEEGIGDLSDVFLFDLDDLHKVIDSNKKKRAMEAEKASKLVDKRVVEFENWCRVQDLNPIIVSLRKQADSIRLAELERSKKKLKNYPDEVIKELDRMSYAIVNKLLHQPITELKNSVKEDKENKVLHIFKSIFNLD